jgi:hypothetical protein
MKIKAEEKEEVVAAAGDDDGAAVGLSNARREFPDAFYCPLTENIMVDPVVDECGKSFECGAVIAKDKREKVTGVTYYPNRALKTIIERELERRDEKGLRSRVRALEESLRSGFDRLVEKSALPSAERRPLPDSFYCPITLELISKPVIDPDGRTYERDAIFNWIRVHGKSPVTRNTLGLNQLRSNEALCDLIEIEKERTDESIDPSIRRWKEDQAVVTGVEGDTGKNQNYPTTQAEIDARGRQSAQVQCSPVAVIFLVLVMLVSLFFFPMCLFCFCAYGYRRREEQED